MAKDGDTYNISSHNQQGGITAGKVHIGSAQRVVDPAMRQALLTNLPKSDRVEISSPLGDGEAYTLANEIKEFLVSEGYAVDGVNHVVRSKPIYGVDVIVGESPRKIQVGFLPPGL